MADDNKIDDFCVSADFGPPQEEGEKKGLTLGFDTEHGSFVWVCGKCSAYKNNFRPSDRKDFFYCVRCKTIAAIQAVCPRERLREP